MRLEDYLEKYKELGEPALQPLDAAGALAECCRRILRLENDLKSNEPDE